MHWTWSQSSPLGKKVLSHIVIKRESTVPNKKKSLNVAFGFTPSEDSDENAPTLPRSLL